MSTQDDDIDTTRTPEEMLKSLIRRDINDEITALAKRALRRRQEGSP